MTSWQIARQWIQQNTDTHFEEALTRNFESGLVYATPQHFLLAHEAHYNPQNPIPLMYNAPSNAWFVELFVSTTGCNPIREFLNVIRAPREYVLWCRRGTDKLRVNTWSQMLRKARLA